MIVDARKRPLLTMLEMVCLSVTERVSFMYNLQQMWEAPICPAIIKKLETFGEHYRLVHCLYLETCVGLLQLLISAFNVFIGHGLSYQVVEGYLRQGQPMSHTV